MELFDKIQIYLNGLDEKKLYQYLAVFMTVLMLAIGLTVFQFYRSTWALESEIEQINDDREQVRTILDKGRLVKKEQKEIDAILKRDENFKIAGYFEDLLGKLGLAQKKLSIEVSSPGREGKYEESVLVAKFAGMTMKELTELLQEIEQNKRVFSKELSISTATKQAGTIDVTLTIATLELKPKEAGEVRG